MTVAKRPSTTSEIFVLLQRECGIRDLRIDQRLLGDQAEIASVSLAPASFATSPNDFEPSRRAFRAASAAALSLKAIC